MNRTYKVMLFKSVSHALSAEKMLKDAASPYKLIPVPKEISSECGVCIRFMPDDEAAILHVLGARIDYELIVALYG